MRPLLLMLFLLSSLAAHAHKASDSYFTFYPQRQHIQLDIAVRDLELAVGLDSNGDDAVSWGELRQAQSRISSYALARLELLADGQSCHLQLRQLQVQTHGDGNYAALLLDSGCPAGATRWQLHYRLLFDTDPLHRGIASLVTADATQTHVLSQQQPVVQLDASGPAGAAVNFVSEGVWHILIGYDHLLFLLCLLLPLTLLRASDGRLLPAAGVWRAVVLVVTAFTVAHSLTLLPAALGWLVLPSRLVESLIALSVVVAALANVWRPQPPAPQRRDVAPRWPAHRGSLRLVVPAFAFGLIHGFGFAGVLGELPLHSGSLLLNVFLFNAGVELGQLGLVLLVLPLLLAVRGYVLYRPLLVRGGSAAMAVCGLWWLTERSLDVQLWPQV